MTGTEPPALEVNANDVVAFLVEIGVLVLLCLAGARLGGSTLVSVALAALLPLVAAVVWGVFAAPRARVDSAPARLVTKMVVLGAGVLAGFYLLPPLWAVGVAVVIGLNLLLMYVGPFARRPVS